MIKTLKIAKANGDTNLDLSFQSLRALPPEISALAATLRNLDLIGNQLVDLPSAFTELTGLTNLKLGENRFTSFPPDTQILRPLRKLHTLSLSGNGLTSLGRLGYLPSLTTLILTRNKIEVIPPYISNLRSLVNLYLGQNQIRQIPPELGGLSDSFTKLVLSQNHIDTIHADSLPFSLTHLDLSQNHIAHLPEDNLSHLTALTHLDLSYNNLNTLPLAVTTLSTLSTLLLHNNLLKELPRSIGALTSLTTLSLHNIHQTHRAQINYNTIKRIPFSIGRMTKLKKLNLDFGSLETCLPFPLSGLPELESNFWNAYPLHAAKFAK